MGANRNCPNCKFCKKQLFRGCVCKHPKHYDIQMPDWASCADFEVKREDYQAIDWSWMFPPEHPQ